MAVDKYSAETPSNVVEIGRSVAAPLAQTAIAYQTSSPTAAPRIAAPTKLPAARSWNNVVRQVSATSPPAYSSPSAASTSDSWPPFITQGQNDWAGQMPQAQAMPQQQQQQQQTQALQYQPSAPTREMASIPTFTNTDGDGNGDAASIPVAPNAGPNDLLMDIDWVKLFINSYIISFLLPHPH